MPNAEIVPFGKYKGQPVERLAQDKDYCEWLASQDWFRNRYATIHSLIINNFGQPAETPEHNALQALFLNEAWAKAFVTAALGGKDEMARRFQKYIDYRRESGWIAERDGPAGLNWQTGLRISGMTFENKGRDVEFESNHWAHPGKYYGSEPWCVECKPTVGDDYPAVLRQMKANNSNALLIGHGGYTGVGATFEQIEDIFRLSGIRIVRLNEVDPTVITQETEEGND